MKEEIENSTTSTVHRRFQSIYKTMVSYCLEGRKNTENKKPKGVKTESRRKWLLSKCGVCDSKKIKIYQRARS